MATSYMQAIPVMRSFWTAATLLYLQTEAWSACLAQVCLLQSLGILQAITHGCPKQFPRQTALLGNDARLAR